MLSRSRSCMYGKCLGNEAETYLCSGGILEHRYGSCESNNTSSMSTYIRKTEEKHATNYNDICVATFSCPEKTLVHAEFEKFQVGRDGLSCQNNRHLARFRIINEDPRQEAYSEIDYCGEDVVPFYYKEANKIRIEYFQGWGTDDAFHVNLWCAGQ